MSNNDTKVTKQETLAALKNPGEIYVVMSAVTRLPFVVCDEETYDDEVFLYYRLEDAQEKAKKLIEEKYQTAVIKVEEKMLLAFYTSLYTMGVNCLSINSGTDTEISIQLSDLVIRKSPDQLPEGKRLIENPSLHLTAIYFMQELRRQQKPEFTEKLKDLQEEMLADYMKGTFIIAIQEDGKLPILQQKNGNVFQPIFTDILELQKFSRGKKMKTAVIPAQKIQDVLIPDAKGVVINPLGVNVQLQIARKKPVADS